VVLTSTQTDDTRFGVLRIAAKFFDRSITTKTFQRGMDAHNHPQFYRQVGKEFALLSSISYHSFPEYYNQKPHDHHNERSSPKVVAQASSSCRFTRDGWLGHASGLGVGDTR
jgi:hypothetical protein